MNRKISGILLAIVLAGAGTLALVAYVRSAKEQAVAGEQRVEVYVLQSATPRGTSLADVRGTVERVDVPAKVRPDDAVTDLDELDEGLVAGVDLAAGEILLESRLIPAEDLSRAPVEEGLQELTVLLEPERAVGGRLRAGDTVGVVLSFEPFDVQDGTGGDQAEQTPNMSHLTFHKITVTSVQSAAGDGEAAPLGGEDGGDAEQLEPDPTDGMLVTLAVSSPQVEQIAFAAEFGHIWLTAENEAADESGTRVVTLGEVYGGATQP